MVGAQDHYPDLELLLTPQGEAVVRGAVRLDHTHAERRVKAKYEIEIHIPRDYPDVPPDVRETGGAIAGDFHTFSDTGYLCLGAPVEVRRLFAEDRTLKGFVDGLVVPFLFSHKYRQLYGVMPYGELAHGYNGILDYYNEQFDAADDLISLRLLELLTGKDFTSGNPCPCGSGRILRECHGPALESLRTHQTPEEWHDELLQILKMFQSGERRTTGRYESMELDSGCGVVKTPTAPTKQDGRRPSNGRDPRNFTPLDPPKRPTGASYGAKTAPTADVRRSSLHREAPEIPKQRGLSILELSPAHG